MPLKGEMIIYDADENYAYQRIKIGDGRTVVSNLPFFVPQVNAAFMDLVTNGFGEQEWTPRLAYDDYGEIALFVDADPMEGMGITGQTANKMILPAVYRPIENGGTYWVRYGNEKVAECTAAENVISFTLTDSADTRLTVQVTSLDASSEYWISITAPEGETMLLNESLGVYTEGEIVKQLEEKFVPALTDEEIDAICGATIYAASEVEL